MRWANLVIRIVIVFLLFVISGYAGNLISMNHGETVFILPSLTIAILSIYFLGEKALFAVFAGSVVLVFLGIPGYLSTVQDKKTTGFSA